MQMGEYEYHANPLDWHKGSADKGKSKKGAESGVFRPPTVGRVGTLFNKIEVQYDLWCIPLLQPTISKPAAVTSMTPRLRSVQKSLAVNAVQCIAVYWLPAVQSRLNWRAAVVACVELQVICCGFCFILTAVHSLVTGLCDRPC